VQQQRRLPLKFLYAIPLRGVTITHLEEVIRVDYAAGVPCELLLRPNLEGDLSLPIERTAAIDFQFDHQGTAPLAIRIRVRGAGWLDSHTEFYRQVRVPETAVTTVRFETGEFRICQNEPLADHLRLDWEAAAPGTLILREITSYEQSCHEYFAPRVDRYGQRLAGDWPGKVHSDDELRADAALPLPAPMGGRDAYGGWMGGPRLTATGFFRIAQDGETWWLVTPEGHPYLSFGPTCVSFGTANTPVAGREELFAELPPHEGAFSQAWFGQTRQARCDAHLYPSRAVQPGPPIVASFYVANLLRKYGEDWQEHWRAVTAARLRHWGMNTCACWSDVTAAQRARLPYLIPADTLAPIDCSGLEGEGQDLFPLRQTPDVFHPEFDQRMGKAFSALERFRDDPYVLGYFVQNEEQWCAWQSPFSLPLHWESRRVFFDALATTYRDIARLNAAWGTRFHSFAHLKAFRHAENPPGLSPQGQADCDDFLRRFADRYFRRIRERLTAVDPNHLFWGCRFLALPPRQAILAGAAPHFDIVSINWYIWHWQSIADIPSFLGNWYRATQRPLVISEYAYELTDARLLAGRWLRPDREERAERSRQFTEGCFSLPFVIGCHWFQYIDEAITGRWDGERAGLGLVDVTDRPHRELVAALRAAGEAMYRVHGVDAPPTP